MASYITQVDFANAYKNALNSSFSENYVFSLTAIYFLKFL